tara:strand:+ start:2039 stop:2221 length:183 start_codon:yes stop_codon:yes gene_type:complete
MAGIYRCVECGQEYNPDESEECPLCGGGPDMEVSYKEEQGQCWKCQAVEGDDIDPYDIPF